MRILLKDYNVRFDHMFTLEEVFGRAAETDQCLQLSHCAVVFLMITVELLH